MARSLSRSRWFGCAVVAGGLVLVPVSWPVGSDAGGVGRLVAYEPLPDDVCYVPSAEQRAVMRQEYAREQAVRAAKGSATPVRTIKDGYPSFAGVSVDPVRNEVVFTDESLFQVLVYDRMENTPAAVPASKPKRVIVGEKTNIEFQSSAWVDPKTGEIFAVNNDTRDTTVIFGAGADGDAAPVRSIRTPHGSFGIAAAEQHDEILITIQHDSAIVAYKKGAGEGDTPVRSLQGLRTKLADPHGIAYDSRDDVMFVANFGATHDVSPNPPGRSPRGRGRGGEGGEGAAPGGERAGRPRGERANWPLARDMAVPGSGTLGPPSISVYRRTAQGNEEPLGVISGPATQLNWPTGLALDSTRRELFVANDMGPSILVFDAEASGNVAPKRVLKGARTGLANPTAVSLDLTNGELWVANFGGHTGTVYDLTAAGNTAPKRTIRNAPANTPSLMIGNPGAVGYDTRREDVLVPNCVAHPQIAVFDRLADKGAARIRAIEGQATMLGRTMHAIAYDHLHDEIVVPQQFGQAILTYAGNASGETRPKRVIIGSQTQLSAPDRVASDPVNNEIYVPEDDKVLVFPREGSGNVAPIRVLEGPDTTMLSADAVTVDPTRNLLIVSGATRQEGGTTNTLLIFDRTASGNTKPRRVITGLSQSRNIAVDPEHGWIFVTLPGTVTSPIGYVGVWNVEDSGKVPPRFTIGGPNGVLRMPRGVVLDAKNKSVIVSDKKLNAILTFEVPEIFAAATNPAQPAR